MGLWHIVMGIFGGGTGVATPDAFGLEYTAPTSRLHYTAAVGRLHYTARSDE